MIQGDLNVRRTGAVDGWCWDTDRPAARVTVELLVDGARVAAVTADAARRDLQRRGIGDGRHAFNVTIDAALLAGGERLVSARDAASRVVFGQYHVGSAAPLAGDPALDALERELGQMSEGLGRLIAARDGIADQSGRLREALATLAAILREAGVHDGDPASRLLAATRAVLARQIGRTPTTARQPDVSLLPLDADLTAALTWTAAVGGGGRHELLLPDDGTAPEVALLPSLTPSVQAFRVRGDGLAATVAAATAVAKAPVLAVMHALGSLVALDDAIGRLGEGILLGDAASRKARTIGLRIGECHAMAGTGLLVAGPPAVLSGLDPALDGDAVGAALDLVRRHPGRPCLGLTEPWAGL